MTARRIFRDFRLVKVCPNCGREIVITDPRKSKRIYCDHSCAREYGEKKRYKMADEAVRWVRLEPMGAIERLPDWLMEIYLARGEFREGERFEHVSGGVYVVIENRLVPERDLILEVNDGRYVCAETRRS